MDSNYGPRHVYTKIPVSENAHNGNLLLDSQHQHLNIGQDCTEHANSRGIAMEVFDVKEPAPHPLGSRSKAWQKGVFASACISSFAFLVNMSALIWITKASSSEEGFKQLYRGSCSTVKSLQLWLHLVINIFSTVLLGASNYCMQCLLAPNRREVDIAHNRGRWLSIGMPSLRNLRYLSKRKATLWSLLALSSIPLHLFYNAAFFAAYQANQYQFFIADESFASGASYNITPMAQSLSTEDLIPANAFIDLSPAQKLQGPWIRFENEECIDAYAQSFYISFHRNIVMITNSSNNTTDQNLDYNAAACESCGSVKVAGYANADFVVGWPCESLGDVGYCSTMYKQLSKNASGWVVYGYEIDHCIVEAAEEECLFNGNLIPILVVAVCNFIKAATMCAILISLRGEPFLVLGDAISSFMRSSDPTTAGMCLLSRDDVTRRKIWPRNFTNLGDSLAGMAAKLPDRWRFLSVGRVNFGTTRMVFLLGLATTIGGYVFTVTQLEVGVRVGGSDSLLSKTSLAVFGFGSPAPGNDWLIAGVSKESPENQVLTTVLIANTPQLFLTFIYLILNRYLTLIYLAVEWSGYTAQRKGLRVSQPSPRTQQRSTYFLQLPYRISLPLMALSTLAHWLTSATVFLAVVRVFDYTGNLLKGQLAYVSDDRNSTSNYAALGFSPAPLALLMGVFLLMLACLLFISLRKIKSGMPIVGCCSAAISAACHSRVDDRGAETKALLWGCVDKDEFEAPRDRAPGHCCFSSGNVRPVVQGEVYM